MQVLRIARCLGSCSSSGRQHPQRMQVLRSCMSSGNAAQHGGIPDNARRILYESLTHTHTHAHAHPHAPGHPSPLLAAPQTTHTQQAAQQADGEASERLPPLPHNGGGAVTLCCSPHAAHPKHSHPQHPMLPVPPPLAAAPPYSQVHWSSVSPFLSLVHFLSIHSLSLLHSCSLLSRARSLFSQSSKVHCTLPLPSLSLSLSCSY